MRVVESIEIDVLARARRRRGHRLALLPMAVGCALVAVGIGWAMGVVQERITRSGPVPGWVEPSGRLTWVLGDVTEAQFYAVVPAGVGLIVAAWLAHWGRVRLRGFHICHGRLPWLFLAVAVGLGLAHAVWGWTRFGGWQPTFAPIVSVCPAVVMMYGSGWRVSLTAGVLGGVLSAPLAMVAVDLMCRPLGAPVVFGNVGSMVVAGLLAFAVCRRLPWMPEPVDLGAGHLDDGRHPSPWWLPRRALADFTEAQFYGSEWAALGLFAGLLVGWLADPRAASYGSGLLPQILTTQLLTAIVAVWWYSGRWSEHGFYPTFVSLVSLAPTAVLTFGGGWPTITVAVLVGALLGPALGWWIGRRMPYGFHPFIGFVASMFVITAVGLGVLKTIQLVGLALSTLH
ncbi:hypothetical protein [Pseudonocardia spinosispora]|uniref:hypothetical protein n=1 Tax=Pseudonocardia spinosispora TaxID=103441 RepID=UPI001FDF3B68|nr:hypothetical protein [Pseudonocardia spinosispora]